MGCLVPNLDTWHGRLGHPNNQAIYDMATKGLAKGMPIDLSLAPPKCEHCILGKQVKSSVPQVHMGKKLMWKLGIIYVDLTGPEVVEPASKNLYLMNIVDDYSNHPWTYTIPLKSNALPVLQAWAKHVEHESSQSVGIIYVDGGELDSIAMCKWCADNGYVAIYGTLHLCPKWLHGVYASYYHEQNVCYAHTDLPATKSLE